MVTGVRKWIQKLREKFRAGDFMTLEGRNRSKLSDVTLFKIERENYQKRSSDFLRLFESGMLLWFTSFLNYKLRVTDREGVFFYAIRKKILTIDTAYTIGVKISANSENSDVILFTN